jgi:hypothetical protein
MSAREPIRRLGELYGSIRAIPTSSASGVRSRSRRARPARGMGAAVGSAGEIADSLREAEARPWRRMLAPVRVIAAPKPPEVTFILPAGLRCATIDWMLAEEPPRSVARPASVSNRECPPPRSEQRRHVGQAPAVRKCADCGRSYTVVNATRCGCSLHRASGDAACANGRRVNRRLVEARLLTAVTRGAVRPGRRREV